MTQRDQGALSRQPQGGLSRFRSADPWREMEEMNRRMNDMFNYFFGANLPDVFSRSGQELGPRTAWQEPEVDIYETDKEYIIRAALPGIEPNNISLQATEDTIELSAESRTPFETSGQGTQSGHSGQSQTQQGTSTTGQTQQGTTASGQQQGTSTSSQTPQGAMPSTSATGTEIQPHTQHRQSRYSSQRSFRFAYTLPTQIDANQVRANFRHGMLEAHLPKLQAVQNRAVNVPVSSEGQTAQNLSGAQTTAGQPGGSHEGAPGSKMGQSYTPNAGEDFTAQPQAPRDRAMSAENMGQTHTRETDVNAPSSQTPTGAGTSSQTPTGSKPNP